MRSQRSSAAIEKEFKKFLFREEILGEKILIFFRIFTSLVLLAGSVLFLKKRLYVQVASIMVLLVFISFIYNGLLFYVIKKDRYRRFMKYISAFIDITSTTFFMYMACITQSPLAVVTTTAPLYLGILMVAANMRRSKLFTIFNIVYILICYNFVYFINYPAIKEISSNKLLFMVGIEGHFFKSFGLMSLGVLLYLMLELRLRLVNRLVKEVFYSKTVREELHRIYDSIIRSVNDGIVIIDEDGIIKFVNRAAEKLTGLSYWELLGNSISTILYSGNSNNNEKSMKENVKLEELVNGKFKEYLLKIKNGGIIPVEVSLATMKSIEGQMVMTIRDITLRKELEEELLQSKKMESIGRLTCGFAHDFNNLILVMEENTRLIENWFEKAGNIPTNRDFKRYIKINRNIIERSKDLINQLLMMGRKETPVLKEISTREIFLGIENILVNMVPQNIKLRVVNLLSKNKSFLLNEASLFQILMNLVINSCDAIGDKEGEIQIKMEEGDMGKFLELSEQGEFMVYKRIVMPREGKSLLICSVSDTGHGIEEGKAFKIFEPYYSTKDHSDGRRSGFGLSIVYTLIDTAHGGLVLKSTPGKGTEFCFCMPAKTVEKIDNEEKKQLRVSKKSFYHGKDVEEKQGYEHNTRTGIDKPGCFSYGKSILLIDDEEDVRFFVRKMLEKMGFEVVETGRGEEAKKLIEGGSDFSLAIVDYNLNGGYGFDEIEEIASRKELPIIVMTGDINEEVAQTKGRGMVKAILKKPFEDDDLFRVIIENSN